jgi:hypothetical protein
MLRYIRRLKEVFIETKDPSHIDSSVYAEVNILHNRPYFMWDPKDDRGINLLFPYQTGYLNTVTG